jgi:hypothetical protein
VDIYNVATQLGTALKTITGLRVYEYGTNDVQAPAAILSLPDLSIDYHQGYGTGASKLSDVVVLVLIRDNTRRASFKSLAGYVKATGVGSIKAALEGATYTACDTVTVTRVDFDAVTWNGADYLAAEFHLDIFGTGA